MSARQSSLAGWPKVKAIHICFRRGSFDGQTRDAQLNGEPAWEFGPVGDPWLVIPARVIVRSDASSGQVDLVGGLTVVDHAEYWAIYLELPNTTVMLKKAHALLGVEYLDFVW